MQSLCCNPVFYVSLCNTALYVCVLCDSGCRYSMWLRSGTSGIWRWKWDLQCSFPAQRQRSSILVHIPLTPHEYFPTGRSVLYSVCKHSSVTSNDLETCSDLWDKQTVYVGIQVDVIFVCVCVLQELVSLVLKHLRSQWREHPLRCLEVGCGSGAISLSLLQSIPQVSPLITLFISYPVTKVPTLTL